LLFLQAEAVAQKKKERLKICLIHILVEICMHFRVGSVPRSTEHLNSSPPNHVSQHSNGAPPLDPMTFEGVLHCMIAFGNYEIALEISVGFNIHVAFVGGLWKVSLICLGLY
jgi:hypothetical protein